MATDNIVCRRASNRAVGLCRDVALSHSARSSRLDNYGYREAASRGPLSQSVIDIDGAVRMRDSQSSR